MLNIYYVSVTVYICHNIQIRPDIWFAYKWIARESWWGEREEGMGREREREEDIDLLVHGFNFYNFQ